MGHIIGSKEPVSYLNNINSISIKKALSKDLFSLEEFH
jgi:hypothetical protein